MRKARFLFMASVALFVMAAFAHAGTITIKWDGDVVGGTIQLGTFSMGTVHSGRAQITVNDNLDPLLPKGMVFNSFCVDLLRYSSNGNVTIDSVSRMSSWTEPNFVQGSAGGPNPFPASTNLTGRNAAAYLYRTFNPTANSTNQKAALGIALWEVLYENSTAYGLYNGFVTFGANWGNAATNGTVAYWATTYLNSVPTPSFVTGYDALWLRTHNNGEAFHSYTQDFIGPPVPEPSSLILLGSGVALAGLLLRRKKK